MQDPFEAAFRDQESPSETPTPPPPLRRPESESAADGEDDDIADDALPFPPPPPPGSAPHPPGSIGGKGRDEDDEDEDENMADVEMGRFSSGGGDPDKMAKMQAILSQFTEEQMCRYESFRRSGFQKSNMKRLLASITGSQKISIPMTIVVSGIAKMFVGDLIETGRMVMADRMESGPIRPCHIREAYRRLKLEGKIPKQPVARLFR